VRRKVSVSFSINLDNFTQEFDCDEWVYHQINLAIDAFKDQDKSLGLFIVGQPATANNSAGCFIALVDCFEKVEKVVEQVV
jgi:hypothetical protein